MSNSRFNTTAYVVSTSKEATLYENKGRRSYFLLENRSGATVYLNFDSGANVSDGIHILNGGTYELESTAPSNIIRVSGSVSTDQRVNITEAFLNVN